MSLKTITIQNAKPKAKPYRITTTWCFTPAIGKSAQSLDLAPFLDTACQQPNRLSRLCWKAIRHPLGMDEILIAIIFCDVDYLVAGFETGLVGFESGRPLNCDSD